MNAPQEVPCRSSEPYSVPSPRTQWPPKQPLSLPSQAHRCREPRPAGRARIGETKAEGSRPQQGKQSWTAVAQCGLPIHKGGVRVREGFLEERTAEPEPDR